MIFVFITFLFSVAHLSVCSATSFNQGANSIPIKIPIFSAVAFIAPHNEDSVFFCFSKAAAEEPAAFSMLFNIFVNSPLCAPVNDSITDKDSIPPNKSAIVSILPPVASFTFNRKSCNPSAFSACALNANPNFSACFSASAEGFTIVPIAVAKRAEASLVAKPPLVNVAIAACISSTDMPAAEAIGDILPIVLANSSKVVLPSLTVLNIISNMYSVSFVSIPKAFIIVVPASTAVKTSVNPAFAAFAESVTKPILLDGSIPADNA